MTLEIITGPAISLEVRENRDKIVLPIIVLPTPSISPANTLKLSTLVQRGK